MLASAVCSRPDFHWARSTDSGRMMTDRWSLLLPLEEVEKWREVANQRPQFYSLLRP